MQRACKVCGHVCHCTKYSSTHMTSMNYCMHNASDDKSECKKEYIDETRALEAYNSKDYFFDRCDRIKETYETTKTKTIQDGFVPQTIYSEATGTIGGKYVRMNVPNTIVVPNYKNVQVSSGLFKSKYKIAVYQYKKCMCYVCHCELASKLYELNGTYEYADPNSRADIDKCCVLF